MAGFADKGMIRMIIRQRRGKQISALLLMTVILCCGCSNHSSWQKAKDRYVVGVVTKSNTSEYWMSVNSGMEAAAAKYDMDVITLGTGPGSSGKAGGKADRSECGCAGSCTD